LPKRSAVRALIVWISGITIVTMLAIGIGFYHYTTVTMVESLRKQARLTADEIASVLILPLYTLDEKAAVNNAMVYLTSGRLKGIRLVSVSAGVLHNSIDGQSSLIPPITREIKRNGMPLGTVTMVMNDAGIRSAQRNTLLIIFLLIGGILTVYALSLHFRFRKALAVPFNHITQGINRFGSNDFNRKIEGVGYSDLDRLVLGLNEMADSIHRKQLEIVESQKKYSSIFNSSFVGILLCEADGRIVDLNDTAEKMFGFTENQVTESRITIQQLLVTEFNDQSIGEFWQKQDEMGEFSFSWKAVRLDTQEGFHAEVAVKRMVLSEKSYHVVNILDSTARKDAEFRLIQAQKMEAIGVLAGGLAHDFNNVLSGITGYLSVLKLKLAKGALPEEFLAQSIDRIEEATFRASKVISQLMAFSKKSPIQSRTVDLNKVVKNVLSIAVNSFDKSIELQAKTPDDPTLLQGDPTQIEQVLLNLCVNAYHAMTIMREPDQPWGGKLSIGINEIHTDSYFRKLHPLATRNDYWCIQVSDTGVGIGKQELSKLYVPFYTTKDKAHGTGLGLSMVFNIVKEHDGFIDVYSEKGIGSSFNVFLPKFTGSQQMLSPEESVVEIKGQGVVLVIDDDDAVRETTKMVLSEFGYEVLTAKDGLEGIERFMASREPPAFVILDLVMPRLSGRETYQQLLRLNPHIKVILVSGFKQDERIQELMEMGLRHFLHKPFSIDKLINTISQLTSDNKTPTA